MLARTRDAAFVNRLVNDPSVRPYVGLPELGEVDLGAIVADQANLVLAHPHGCFVLMAEPPDGFELHTLFLPGGRGRTVLRAAAEMLAIVFGETRCGVVRTYAPSSNPAALWSARQVGFRPVSVEPDGWQDAAGRCDLHRLALTRAQWEAKRCRS